MKIYAYPSGTANIRFVAAPSLRAAMRFSKRSGGDGKARLATRAELEAAYAQSSMVPKAASDGNTGGNFASAGDFL